MFTNLLTIPFTFLDPGKLEDGNLSLHLDKTTQAIPSSDRVPTYHFHMHLRGHEEPVGNISLRIGNTTRILLYAGHIGYEVEPQHRGQNLAARSTKLLLPLAAKHHIHPIWITCNPDNIPSRRTCEKIGAEMIEIVPIPRHVDFYRIGERHKCRYCLPNPYVSHHNR